jgi:SAM-dependent methyltransferase
VRAGGGDEKSIRFWRAANASELAHFFSHPSGDLALPNRDSGDLAQSVSHPRQAANEASLPNSHYDVVCNFGGIACWPDPVRARTNIRRCLKPDGVFVLNHFDVDGLPTRIHFACHLLAGNHGEVPVSGWIRGDLFADERQYASLGRVAGYLKQRSMCGFCARFSLDNVTVPVTVPGTIFSICRNKPA